MSKPLSLARLLLITSALSAPSVMAQTSTGSTPSAGDSAPTSGVPLRKKPTRIPAMSMFRSLVPISS